ncbi:MAG TPA: hypothetical protein VGN34_24215, partial [Ktedonobacteraceae bacterium]
SPNQESSDHGLVGYLGPTPPPGLLPPRGERLWVERPEQLQQAVSVLSRSQIVAIDAEFTQVRSRTQQQESESSVPRLALLQLAIDQRCFVVDTLRLQDLSPLAAVVANPAIATLLHGAGADLRVMAERGLYVAHYYDLEATCRSIFGQHESSLAAMLQRAFHSHLDKSLQRTDWTRRPLPPAMIAYAARDAEVTLALYYWLKQHYESVLQLHENTAQLEKVAPWIEPFLRGTAMTSPEIAVAEARTQGIIQKKSQVVSDCRAALVAVTHPMRRNRLLRLIADLSLIQLAPDILPLLHALTSDERAGSARTLGRLGVKSAREELQSLLQDQVQDVRKAAQTALRNLDDKDQRQQQRSPTTKAVDGSRTWIVENDGQAGASDDDQSWKARLRSMIDS